MPDSLQQTMDNIEHNQTEAAMLAEANKGTGINRMIAFATVAAVVVSLLSWLVLVTIDRTAIADRISMLDRDAMEARQRITRLDEEVNALKITAAKIDGSLSVLQSESKSHGDKLDLLLSRRFKDVGVQP